MRFSLIALLPTVTLALPLPIITNHETISNNPIQVHKSPFSWLPWPTKEGRQSWGWPWSPVEFPRLYLGNGSFVHSNTTVPSLRLAFGRPHIHIPRFPNATFNASVNAITKGTSNASIVLPHVHTATSKAYSNVTAPRTWETRPPFQVIGDNVWRYVEHDEYGRSLCNHPSSLYLGRSSPPSTAWAAVCVGRWEVWVPSVGRWKVWTQSEHDAFSRRAVDTKKLFGGEDKKTEEKGKKCSTDAKSDTVEGHSVGGFWSKFFPDLKDKEIEKFLNDLGGFYKDRIQLRPKIYYKRDSAPTGEECKIGQDSDPEELMKRGIAMPDPILKYMIWDSRCWERFLRAHPDYFPWEKRDLDIASTQTLVGVGEKLEGLEAKGGFKLAEGAMVKDGHWDGAMRSKNLDEDANCGPLDYGYLNERCVKSNDLGI